MDYLGAAAAAWFLGFFPLTEAAIAVPAALASGLDTFSAIFWTVLGNLTPVLLIHYGYEGLMRIGRLRNWMDRLVSEKSKARFDKWGVWFILVFTPWIGVWAMGVTAKALQIDSRRFIAFAFISVTIYAVVLTFILQAAASLVN